MNIDPSTPNREVLIRYLESSGVNQQKEAAAEMRKMEEEIRAFNTEIYSLEMRNAELETVCAQAYQVVGVLSDDCGRFDDDDVIKILDNLSDMKMTHADVLPFASKKKSLTSRIALWFKKGK